MKMLSALTLSAALVAFAPAAQAGKVVIPVYQNQTAINNGTQNQGAGGSGNASQTGVLEQSNQQSQAVNVYVPNDFRGKVQTTYFNGDKGFKGERGNSFYNRRDGRGFQPGNR